MQYELHWNLRKTAALKIAITFWERNEVKNKAAKVLESYDKFEEEESSREWRELTKTIVNEWNKDELPQILEVELVHLVRMIGQIIFNWYQYIKYEYGVTEDAISFIDKIKWTPYGTVDVVNTFKSFWLENPNLDITKKYNFACRHAITDHINELWDKIPRDKQNDCYKDIYEHFDQHILAYWKCCRENDLPNLIRYCQVAANEFNGEDIRDFVPILNGASVLNLLYDSDRSTEENMLRLTVYQGHFNAMKYFWEKLTEQEKEESVLKCACIAVLRWDCYVEERKNTRNYKVYQCIEICIFLMNQMTNSNKKLFFNKNLEFGVDILHQEEFDVKSRILEMLLLTWPWEDLLMPILEDMLLYIDDDSKMDCTFLEAITFHIRTDHELGYSLKTSKYRSLLREVWLIIPAPIKQKIPQQQTNRWFSSIGNLVRIWDLNSLNLIINDPAITDVKDQFINCGTYSYEKLVANDQFEKLDQLMEKLFKFDKEQKKSFKQNLNPWSMIFENREVNVADKFLVWQSNIPEERRSFKNNINHRKVCVECIENDNFEAFDRFLDWKFETLEERMKCKDHFKIDIFTIKRVYDIWTESRRNIDDAEEKSSRFLKWLFESNEEIKYFKTEKLANREYNDFISGALLMLYAFNIIDEFLSWCSLDSKEIQQFRLTMFRRNRRRLLMYV